MKLLFFHQATKAAATSQTFPTRALIVSSSTIIKLCPLMLKIWLMTAKIRTSVLATVPALTLLCTSTTSLPSFYVTAHAPAQSGALRFPHPKLLFLGFLSPSHEKGIRWSMNLMREGVFMFSMLSIVEALVIVTALSFDAFVSSFSYGAGKIKIPLSSLLVINLICSGTLALALLSGGALSLWLPREATTALSFLLLLSLGIIKIFDSALKSLIRKHRSFEKKIHFSISRLDFILNVYANPEEADRDHSRILSPSEAAFLALALSLDGLAVGFGAGLSQTGPLLVVAFSLMADTLAIALGSHLGNHFSRKLRFDLSWLSGALLILLAIIKLP